MIEVTALAGGGDRIEGWRCTACSWRFILREAIDRADVRLDITEVLVEFHQHICKAGKKQK
jgi:hypothetical protein